MIGKIFRIDQMKSSHNKGQEYQRVHFEEYSLENGKIDHVYAHLDIVPTFRNYARWKPFLRIGVVLSGLEQLRNGKINADSRPVLVKEPEPYVSQQRVPPPETKSLF